MKSSNASPIPVLLIQRIRLWRKLANDPEKMKMLEAGQIVVSTK